MNTFISAIMIILTAETSIKQAEMYFNIPPKLLEAICFVESSNDTRVITPNDGGVHTSVGLCQVQMRTAKQLGFTGTQDELLNPGVNAIYAAKYLRTQFNKYRHWSDAVAAYNRGSVKKIKGKYINQAYVDKVYAKWRQK